MSDVIVEHAGPIPSHDTGTVDKPWDAAANLKRLGDNPGRAKLRAMHAWVDPNGDPATKAAYKLPHHEVSSDGTVGAANLAGVRAALSRVGQTATQIPQADVSGVRAHLNRHLNKGRSSSQSLVDLDFSPGAALAELEGHVWAIRPLVLGQLTALAYDGRFL